MTIFNFPSMAKSGSDRHVMLNMNNIFIREEVTIPALIYMVGLKGIKQGTHMVLVMGNTALEKVPLRSLPIIPAIFRFHVL
jgi:hypothetical protein